jgi:hypothetical protein
MSNLQVLKEIEKDYDDAINFLHDQSIRAYIELSEARNKREKIRKLIKNLSGKNK